MIDELTIFVELDEPVGMGSLGWYVGCVNILHEDYYLHENGVIYSTCAPRYNTNGDQVSTGWFKLKIDAYFCSQLYYNKHGLKYSYADNVPVVVATNKTDSQVMEFI